jgi:chaperone required for assembly of F1-ATPase
MKFECRPSFMLEHDPEKWKPVFPWLERSPNKVNRSGIPFRRHSGMVRKHQTSDAQLRIGESRDSGFDAVASPPE